MKSAEQNLLQKILFIDIETVPQFSSWQELPENTQALWEKKTKHQRKEQSPEEYYLQLGGIQAEFSKIVCISCLHYSQENAKIKSYASTDEVVLLKEFAEMLVKSNAKGIKTLCAHNGKEFDYPVICRRMLILGIELPPQLQLSNKKSWQIPHYDTMEMWRFGDYKHYSSLDLLANIFGIPTPKSDIDGSQVADVYYKEKDLDRIVGYCEKDTLTLFKIFCRIKGIVLDEKEE